jgi:hypothetical protein
MLCGLHYPRRMPAPRDSSQPGTSEVQTHDVAEVPNESAIRILPSGRSIVASIGEAGEAIEIHSPEGELELSIALTEEGPVVRIQGAKLDLVSTDSISVQCKHFELETESDIRLRAKGAIEMETHSELRTKSAGQTFFDGDYVNLNCRDRQGYHDALEQPELPADTALEEPDDAPES